MSSAIEFKYINPEFYRHPGERDARARLEKIPGFQKALAALADNTGVQAERQAEIGSMIRVGPGAYPELALLWNDSQQRFGLNGVPLHVAWDLPSPCLLRGGNDHPRVILDSRMLETLPEREMTALLAMQAGSVRLGNANLIAACDFSRWFMDFYGIAGAPAALPAWGLENWRRQALFSADRAAALSLGGAESVAALLERFAGAGGKAWGGVTQPDDLRLQGIEALSLQGDWSNSRLRRFALAMNRQNNVALVRRLDILDWFSGETPARILSGELTEPEAAKPGSPSANADAPAADPSLAYWGEFAGGADKEPGRERPDIVTAFATELKEAAEKNFGAFYKAGEAFWNTLVDNTRKQ